MYFYGLGALILSCILSIASTKPLDSLSLPDSRTGSNLINATTTSSQDLSFSGNFRGRSPQGIYPIDGYTVQVDAHANGTGTGDPHRIVTELEQTLVWFPSNEDASGHYPANIIHQATWHDKINDQDWQYNFSVTGRQSPGVTTRTLQAALVGALVWVASSDSPNVPGFQVNVFSSSKELLVIFQFAELGTNGAGVPSVRLAKKGVLEPKRHI